MKLIDRFLDRTDFNSYEDFKENFRLNVPERFNFARDVVDAWAELEPDKQALVYCNDAGDERRFSFTEISLLSKKAAKYFSDIGICEGDRVVVMLRRRYEYWIIAVALHRLGATLVPASVQFTTKDIEYRIKTARARALIFIDTPFVVEQVSGIDLARCPTLTHNIYIRENGSYFSDAHDFCGEYEKCEPYEGYEQRENDAEFLAYFTSGTTNMPKMALHNKTYPLGHIITARYMQHNRDNGLHLTQADSGWAKFGWGNIYAQWICGCAILAYDPERYSSRNLMAAMEKYGPTSVCVPPTIFRFLLNDGLAYRHVKSVEWFSTAGEPLSPEVNKEFERISGKPIHEGFGQSEGTPITCSFEWFDVRPGSMGKPSALYDVMIVDADGQPVPQGEMGEIVIDTQDHSLSSVGLTIGYIIDDEYHPSFDELYHTGDIAYEDEDGYYWFVGRNDDIIKSSGYRIGPFEIESVLNTHEAVRECAIIGRPDPLRGQVVCAIICLNEDYEESDALTAELQSHVKHNTAPYKYPRVIEYVDALPKTSSGKIIRRVL